MKDLLIPYKRYWPLVCLLLVSFIAACALSNIKSDGHAWMHFFMGFLFCCFAMFKLFDPIKFADAFQMYDILGKQYRIYAYIYIFIELFLGISYFSFALPVFTYLLTVVFLVFSMVGVVMALIKKVDVNCACMGTVLDVPLSTVTLTEDVLMAGMALYMLFM